MDRTIRIGTRASKLALWQAYYIADLLKQGGWDTEIVEITTKGDRILDVSISKIGSKGVFTEELERSEHFTITDELGPDTLIINGALHDIVSRVPPESAGRSEIWLDSLGEATLIIELRDSLSNEVIYRAVERRAVQGAGNQMILSGTATNWGEVRRWARRWAVRLREGLDSIHQ